MAEPEEPKVPPSLDLTRGMGLGLAGAAILFILAVLAWSLGLFGANPETPVGAMPTPAASALIDPRG